MNKTLDHRVVKKLTLFYSQRQILRLKLLKSGVSKLLQGVETCVVASKARCKGQRRPSADAQPHSLLPLLSGVEGNAGGLGVVAHEPRSGTSLVTRVTPNRAFERPRCKRD